MQRTVSFYLNSDLDDLVGKISEKSGISKSKIIEDAILQWFKIQVRNGGLTT